MSYGGSSGGSSRISTALDVALSSPANAEVLTYDSSTQKWKNAAVSGGSGGSAGANDTLVYNAAAHNILPSTADSGPAINSLITTLNSNGGGVIVFPPGEYHIGTTIMLKGGVYLISFAPNHGYIAASPSSQSVKFSANSGLTGWIIDSVSCWSTGIQGIDLSGNGNVGGIRLRGVYWGAVKQSMANACTIGFCQASPADGSSAGFACVWEDLQTTNCVSSSVTAVTGSVDIDGTDHYISRIEAAASSTGSLKNASKYCVAFVLRGSNHFVDNSVFETSDRGAVIYANKSRFSSCRADTNNGDGWWIIGGTNRFVNCDAIGNGQAATNTHDGFIIDNGAWGCTFTNCSVFTAGSILCRYGVNDQMTIAEPVYAAGYVNCKVENAGTARWNLTGQSSAVQFPGFPIKPASSATPDVHETSGIVDLGNYTSATTITNLLGGTSGQSIKLLGNANVTVANNTTIKTNTGANITLAGNRLYFLSFYQGVWYMQ